MIAHSFLSPRRGLAKAAARILAATCVVLSVAAAPMVFAQGANSGVIPPGSTISRLTYGQWTAPWWYGLWSAAWWQWLLAIQTGPEADQNPQHDATGLYCGTNQSGPVWYLAGMGNGQSVARNCTIPSTKAIFFPLINVECSTLDAPPFHCSDAASCRTCATTIGDGIGVNSLNVSIDGVPVKIGVEAYRAQSPFFSFTVPGQNILNSPEGSGMSVSDGYWIMLKPLSPGRHTIHLGGIYVRSGGAGFSQDVTYSIDVTP